MYTIKEIFYTLQGEGANTGRAAVFCRFTGCNLWTGHEEDRDKAVCQFCDTDFVGTDGPGGGKFGTAEEVAKAVAEKWPDKSGPGIASHLARPRVEDTATSASSSSCKDLLFAPISESAVHLGRPLVVCTGGEPLLQLDGALVNALHEKGFEIAVETNGTRQPPPGLDWICVSPKAGADLVLTSGDELKLVYPQFDAEPHLFEDLEFRHFFLQPMDSPDRQRNTQLAVEYCLKHPRWRLSLQTHKLVGLP